MNSEAISLHDSYGGNTVRIPLDDQSHVLKLGAMNYVVTAQRPRAWKRGGVPMAMPWLFWRLWYADHKIAAYLFDVGGATGHWEVYTNLIGCVGSSTVYTVCLLFGDILFCVMIPFWEHPPFVFRARALRGNSMWFATHPTCTAMHCRLFSTLIFSISTGSALNFNVYVAAGFSHLFHRFWIR